ncbi:universal stress protein [Desulfopila sp. IMCC35006]|uniref:universal stress protein n=1 Tax=Desulfopila sp. IMCC35006 TaxID=2569542 RepID=UPI0010AB8169|nr:universal stress protein [Desulfopila sp. IMCC35006]TKB27528.1 universal stress protein [Desulfopila sp. IMCC35006]
MKKLDKIIAGIDFSVYSARILQYAAGIAERNEAELIAVSVINKRQIDYIKEVCRHEDPGTITLEKFINDETRRRTVNLEDMFRQYVPKMVATRSIIRSGVPFEEILLAVADEEADLVVISSKGRTNFKDYMFGTTSEKIFRHCPVSLLSLNLRQ